MLADLGHRSSTWCWTSVVDHDEVVRRLSGRRTCKKCGHVWHVEFDPPPTPGVCDSCGGELYQRDDDQRRDGPAPARGLRRADRAARSTSTASAASWSAIDATRPGRGRHRAGDRARLTPLATPSLTVRAACSLSGIELKTPEQIALMREAGLVVAARAARRCARPVAPGRHHRRPGRAGRATCSREQGAIPSFLGYHGVIPAVDLRLGQRRIVHGIPGDRRGAGRGRPDLHRLRRDRRRLARRLGDHRRRRRGRPGAGRAVARSPRTSMWDGIAAVRAGGRLTDISHAVETAVRGAGPLRHRRPATAATASAPQMHMEPHDPQLRPRRAAARKLRAGHGAGDRADDHARLAGRPRSSTTAGPW